MESFNNAHSTLALRIPLSYHLLVLIQRGQNNGDITQSKMTIEKHIYRTTRQTHNAYQNKMTKPFDLSVALIMCHCFPMYYLIRVQ